MQAAADNNGAKIGFGHFYPNHWSRITLPGQRPDHNQLHTPNPRVLKFHYQLIEHFHYEYQDVQVLFAGFRLTGILKK